MSEMIEDRIVLVGGEEDFHLEAVKSHLEEYGAEPVCFDPRTFPDSSTLSLGDELHDQALDTSDVSVPAAVYIRSMALHPLSFGVDVQQEMEQNWKTTLIAFREREELLRSLFLRWEHLGVPVYNPVSTNNALRKPYQIARLKDAGIPVPETLWTNDPEDVLDFVEGREVIYKPVRGGASTRKLTEEDLTEKRLQALSNAPVTFQELLPGEDIRVYVLDEEIIGAFRIHTEEIDYRQNEQDVELISLSDDVHEICQKTVSTLGLRFTGMDLKADTDGKLKVLEANPSPMFLGFDQWTDSTLLEAFGGRLMSHK